MSGTSSIQKLPNEISKNNVIMSIEDKVNNSNVLKQQMGQQMGQQQMPQQMPNNQQQIQQQIQQMHEQNAVNTVINGIQGMQYSTDLPNRDIPMNTNHITQDNTTRPNYVPEATNKDYIKEEESLQEMIEKNKKSEKESFELNHLYDELTTPILIMILYFIFQLPFLQKLMLKHVPSLFSNDKNLTLPGYILKTILFGCSYYGLSKLMEQVNNL